jgi:hypothetical protein
MNNQHSRLSKEELRQKLREKINGHKMQRMPSNQVDESIKKKPVNKKQYNKLVTEATKQLKEMAELNKEVNDAKITPLMLGFYDLAVQTYDEIKVPSPSELLNNVEDAKKNFKEYLATLIDTCKKTNVPRDTFVRQFLNCLYTEYHVAVLGVEVVPEKLRSELKLSVLGNHE